MKLSNRGAVDPFIVMDVMSAAAEAEAEGRHVIHMEVGQPAHQTPQSIRDAVSAAINTGNNGYTLAQGMLPLREKLSAHYKVKYDLAIDPSRFALTMGSSSAFILAFLAMFDVGDRVAIATPAYPAYKNILESLGLEVVFIETDERTRYTITPEMLEAVMPVQGLLIASPANPTGTMMSPDSLQALVDCCENLDISLISDEIYHGLTYSDIEERSALHYSQNVVVINSFSKYFCMTGWRIGWMVLPDVLVRQVERLAQNLFISPPYLSQIAAIAALDAGAECEEIKLIYAENRRILLEGLPKAGFTKLLPVDGAFYIYADVGHLTNDSREFAAKILREVNVAVTPGVDFDPLRGNRTLRFSFAGSNAEMIDSINRLMTLRLTA
jgi:aspartate/methionine/tyrosine aminotransferase